MDIIQMEKHFGLLFSAFRPSDLLNPLRGRRSFARHAAVLLALFSAIFNCYNLSSAAVLTHRYTFDVDGRDSISGPNATLLNNAKIQDGAVVFDGAVTTAVAFPAELLISHTNSTGVKVAGTNLTAELWVLDETRSSLPYSYAIFNLGSSKANYALSVADPALARASMGELFCPLMPVARTNHLVWTQDAQARTTRLYLNGELQSQKPNAAPVTVFANQGVLSSLGFRGKVFEFRVYQGVLTELEVACNEAAGPDVPSIMPGELGAIRISAPATVGPDAMTSFKVFADFENLTNVNITTLPELSVSSLTPGVIEPVLVANEVPGTNENAVASLMTATRKLSSYEPGVGQILAEFRGKSAAATITVQSLTNATLVHRFKFDEPAGATVAYDSVGGAHARLAKYATFTGSGGLTLNNGYAFLPEGILSGMGEVSIETWVTPSSLSGWDMIFNFGDQRGGRGKSYIFATASAPRESGYTLRAGITPSGLEVESPRLDWTNALPLNVTSHVVLTYSPRHKFTSLYVDGQLIASGVATYPLASIIDVRNFIGASQFARDPLFYGRFDEFRIFKGILLDTEVTALHQAGPDIIPLLPQDGLEYSLIAPQPLGAGMAEFRVLANPGSVPTQMFFEYGSTVYYGARTPEVDLGSGNERKVYSAAVSDLPLFIKNSPTSQVHVRAAFIRNGQTYYSSDLQFTTPIPIVAEGVSNVSPTSVVFHGLVAPNALPTSIYVDGIAEVGTNRFRTDPIVMDGGPGYIPFAIPLGNLEPNRKYQFFIVASNSLSTNSTPLLAFTTASELRIQNFTRTQNQVRLQYSSVSGPTCTLYASSDLLTWTALTNGISLTTGTNTLTASDPIEPPRFYKLEGR